jgi:hypothetical protein
VERGKKDGKDDEGYDLLQLLELDELLDENTQEDEEDYE